ncbi:MAG TPA: hypothetical protein VF179_09190 [Thermoanaerobaculia bacterium]|nr:hypothetical protein [Thermoanaerobaculia bacterium]
MIRSASVLLLAMLMPPYHGMAQEPPAPTLIQSPGPWSDAGFIQMEKDYEGVPQKIESGELSGVAYRFYYTDGSGSFAGERGNRLQLAERNNWSVACSKDPINDAKSCYMYVRDLWVFAHSPGKVVVSIGHDHYPGSTVAIRIDGRAPSTARVINNGTFSHDASTRIVQDLRKAKTVTTRYMEWPYRSWVDETWEIYGFNEALDYITWAVRQIR